MANNRVSADVNLTEVAQRLEGYSGSDIKEVCRDAVVRGAHELARRLDQGLDAGARADDARADAAPGGGDDARADAAPGGGDDALGDDALEGGGEARLRPVSREDFELALRKLSASVSERGKELSRVLEWNDEYGEIKRKKKRPNLSMYL